MAFTQYVGEIGAASPWAAVEQLRRLHHRHYKLCRFGRDRQPALNCVSRPQLPSSRSHPASHRHPAIHNLLPVEFGVPLFVDPMPRPRSERLFDAAMLSGAKFETREPSFEVSEIGATFVEVSPRYAGERNRSEQAHYFAGAARTAGAS